MKKKYESEMLQVIHEDMMGLHESGIISDKRMREFDKLCLAQEPKTTRKATSPQGRSGGTKPAVRTRSEASGISAKGACL